MHDNTLTQDNRDKFIYIAGRYGQIIKFYNVEKICADEIANIKKLFANYTQAPMFSIAKFFKFMIPFALSEDIEKIIYLDSDTIINLDINELWQINIGNKSLGAVPESMIGVDTLERFKLCQEGLVAPEDYFNSGVMVMNLKKIRQSETERIWSGIKYRAENPKYSWFDQEILNYCFTKDFFKLDIKFNVFLYKCRERGDFRTNQRIFHYVKNALGFDLSDSFNNLWFKCFEKTPWFTKEIIAHIDEEYKKIINQRNDEKVKELNYFKNFAVQMSALILGKSRAFVTIAPNVDAVKKSFLVRDYEEIIPLINKGSLNALVKSMNESRGRKIYFIIFDSYDLMREYMINAGFVEGEDFINAAPFLPNANGVELSTNPLVRAM